MIVRGGGGEKWGELFFVFCFSLNKLKNTKTKQKKKTVWQDIPSGKESFEVNHEWEMPG